MTVILYRFYETIQKILHFHLFQIPRVWRVLCPFLANKAEILENLTKHIFDIVQIYFNNFCYQDPTCVVIIVVITVLLLWRPL